MRNGKLLIMAAALTVLLPLIIAAQPVKKLWDVNYGGRGNDGISTGGEGIDVYAWGNTIYAIGSGDMQFGAQYDNTCANDSFGYDVWIVAMDTLGNKLWDKCYGGLGNENFLGASCMAGNSILIAAFTTTNIPSGNMQVAASPGETSGTWFFRIDAGGNIVWQSRFSHIRATDVVWQNGKIYATGYTANSIDTADLHAIACKTNSGVLTGDSTDMFLMRMDSTGLNKTAWLYGGYNDQRGGNLLPIPFGGFVVGGTARGYAACNQSYNPYSFGGPHAYYDFYVYRINESGSIVWQQHYGNSDHEWFNAALLLKDGSIMLTGTTISGQGNDVSQPHQAPTVPQAASSQWLLKTDSAGNKLWDKRYDVCHNGSVSALSTIHLRTHNNMLQTEDGGFLIYNTVGGDTLQGCAVTESNRGGGERLLDYKNRQFG